MFPKGSPAKLLQRKADREFYEIHLHCGNDEVELGIRRID